MINPPCVEFRHLFPQKIGAPGLRAARRRHVPCRRPVGAGAGRGVARQLRGLGPDPWDVWLVLPQFGIAKLGNSSLQFHLGLQVIYLDISIVFMGLTPISLGFAGDIQ